VSISIHNLDGRAHRTKYGLFLHSVIQITQDPRRIHAHGGQEVTPWHGVYAQAGIRDLPKRLRIDLSVRGKG